MNIGYHYPSLDHIYAQRTIRKGYMDACHKLGIDFFTFTNQDKLEDFLSDNKIDIFITASHSYYQKAINLDILREFRNQGLKVFVKLDWRNSPFTGNSIREGVSLSKDENMVKKIINGSLGDYFYSVFEENDRRMKGFIQNTGKKYYCIPLACNPNQQFYDLDSKYKNQISFLGSRSKNKKKDFQELLYPLKAKGLKLYGQDWSRYERKLGDIQRVGQYFNIEFLSKIQKPKLPLDAERKIYSSTDINLNIHEWQQKKYGGDCNERTFKILTCGGFQITDDVACIHKYLKNGKEIVIAKDKKDWFEKIDYYMNHPEERKKIAEAGRRRVLQDHTYHNRVQQILDIYYGKHD